MENKEIWKPIPGYEGIYMVSSMGRVKSLDRVIKTTRGNRKRKERIRKLTKTKYGYLSTCLHKDGKHKGFLVHRLVAMAFIENPGSKPQVNHINSERDDNNVNNLEWCTAYENVWHGIKHGFIPSRYKGRYFSHFKKEQILKIRSMYKTGKYSHASLADIFEVHHATISKIVNRKSYKQY